MTFKTVSPIVDQGTGQQSVQSSATEHTGMMLSKVSDP